VKTKVQGNEHSIVKLKALYALYPPLKMDSEASTKLYYKLLEDFSAEKPVPLRGTFHDGERPSVAARPCPAGQRRRYFKKAPFLAAGDAILEFSATLKFPGQEKFFFTDHTGARIQQTREEAVAAWKSHLPLDLELPIQTYLCALMITYPGAARPIGNVWIVDDSTCLTDQYYVSQIHESIEYFREKATFPQIDIQIDQAVQWIFSQNGIFDGYSDTPASRSLNYFTRLFVSSFRSDELSDFVWALAGIEAILVEGGRSSGGQLREKLCSIFGHSVDISWLKKQIADAYNYRSRMIHGDRQIRSSFRDNEDTSDKRFDEEYDSLLFAIGIFVLLLRYLISRNANILRFKTVIEDGPNECVSVSD
jgi:hypothetical protein